MKTINKLLVMMLCSILVFNPAYVNATEENDNNINSVTEGENQEENNTENNNTENSGSESENNQGTEEEKPTTGENQEENNTENSKPENNGSGSENNQGTPEDKPEVEEPPVVIEKSSDATLKSLSFNNAKFTLDKEFKSDVFEYKLNIPADIDKISKEDIKYELSDSKAEVIMVNIPPEIKTNKKITVIVKAENGDQKEYVLNVVKEQPNLNLKKLELNGYALNETFDPETQTYTANIPYEIEMVTVNAVAQDKNAKITISGNKNLIVGQNVVKVTVGGTNVYKIIVIRDKETSVEENPTSIITSSGLGNATSSSNNNKNDINNSEDDGILKYVIVSIASLILFAIGGIGLYFYFKTSPKKLKKELDKISEVKENDNSPVVEVNENQEVVENTEAKVETNNSNIGNLMDEKLVETREFTKDELNNTELENLFDDEEDV